MDVKEFKAWFEGFCESIGEAPTPEQFAKIKAKVQALEASRPFAYRSTGLELPDALALADAPLSFGALEMGNGQISATQRSLRDDADVFGQERDPQESLNRRVRGA